MHALMVHNGLRGTVTARRLVAAALWLAALAVPVAWLRSQDPGAPRAVDARVVTAAGPLMIGTPFAVEIRFQAPPAGRWVLPECPQRYGDFTLRAVRVEPSGRAGYDVIRLELQAFRTGRIPLPAVPVVWRSPLGADIPLTYPPGEITVAGLLRGAGPFAPQPPRGGLAASAVGFPVWLWILGGVVLAAAAAASWWLWRRSRPPAPDLASPREVNLAYFRERLNRVWGQRAAARSPQELSGRLVDVFRDFLAWRFRTDLHALTTTELCLRLAGPEAAGPEGIEPIRTVLAAADESRFSFTAADADALVAAFVEIMERLGSRDAQPAVDTQVRSA
ncbi:MAG TPA: hypothetical protein PK017_13250 [Acidobacteriota bacterium]|nr:hypothetical protein [Acidobacteriota bacterium]